MLFTYKYYLILVATTSVIKLFLKLITFSYLLFYIIFNIYAIISSDKFKLYKSMFFNHFNFDNYLHKILTA